MRVAKVAKKEICRHSFANLYLLPLATTKSIAEAYNKMVVCPIEDLIGKRNTQVMSKLYTYTWHNGKVSTIESAVSIDFTPRDTQTHTYKRRYFTPLEKVIIGGKKKVLAYEGVSLGNIVNLFATIYLAEREIYTYIYGLVG